MLTPAEEQGLAGLALASRVQHALYRTGADRAGRADRAAPRRGARRSTSSTCTTATIEPIRILPAPITVLPDQVAYLHSRHPDGAERAQAPADALPPRLHRARDPAALPERGALAARVLGAEPGGAQPGLRPARRADRLHQPDVEGHAAVRRAQPERHRRPAHGADLRAADRRDRGAGAPRAATRSSSSRWATTCASCSPRSCSTTWPRSAAGRRVCFVEPKYAGNGPDEQAAARPVSTRPPRAHA